MGRQGPAKTRHPWLNIRASIAIDQEKSRGAVAMQIPRETQTRKLVLIVAIEMVMVLAALAVLLFHSPLRSLVTFRQVDDYPLYVMHTYEDYHFGSFLETGIQADVSLRWGELGPAQQWACSCFATLNGEGQAILGRNFDWFNQPALLLYTHPADGYASASMVGISYLGFDTGEPSWLDRMRLLEAPYLPFDGMNEAGLAVGMMAVPHAQAGDDPRRVTIGSLHAIRLLLDNAASVDEAISLLQAYNLDWEGGPPLHYLVADSFGDSAVIEFLGGAMSVVRNEESWQVSTNFILTDRAPGEATSLCPRYASASKALQEAEGDLSDAEAMSLLEEVSQQITMWSVVYNMATGDISVAVGREYDRVHEFDLQMLGR